jgi:cytochrome P450
LLTAPEIRTKVEAELMSVIDASRNLPKWSTLEQLPYLSAVLLEAIRHSYGVATRLPRVAPDETLIYDGKFGDKPVQHVIPPGTAIGMSSVIMHANRDIFPDPDEFRPERWLMDDGTRRKELEGYLFSFGKGTRQCLGMK